MSYQHFHFKNNNLDLHNAMIVLFRIANLWLANSGNIHFNIDGWNEISKPPNRHNKSASISNASN